MTKIKAEGRWEEYQKQMYNQALDNLINNFRDWADDELKENNNAFVTEDGVVENWVGGKKYNLKKNINDSLEYLESLKQDTPENKSDE